MLSQKMKRVISIVLIVCMTFCSNGFSVLAGSVDDVVKENAEASSGQETPNYYLEYKEYHEEQVIIKTKNVEDDNKSSDDEKSDEGKKSDGEESKETTTIKKQDDDQSDNPDNSFAPSSDDEEGEKENAYAEEPEEDETKKSEEESSVEESSSEESSESVEEASFEETSSEETTTETSDEESSDETSTTHESETDATVESEETSATVETETSESVEESTTVTETSVEESETTETIMEEETTEKSQEDLIEATTEANVDNIEDIKVQSEVEFTDATASETEKEIKIVKKYIIATRSIPEDSVWSVKEILANEGNASFKQIPSTEEIKEKYLAKEVKVLVENQYGDQKVVTVPAKWDVQILSKVYRPEYVPEEKNYKADADGNVLVLTKDGEVESEIKAETDEDEIVETKVETEGIQVETSQVETADVESTEVVDEKVTGFTSTDETSEDEGQSPSDGEYDTVIGDNETIYEYEELPDDSPIIPDDDELEKKDVIQGNAKNGIVTKESAGEEGVAVLDLANLASQLGGLLGTEISIDFDKNLGLPLLGLDPHKHWVCGRANCSDTVRNHFNENMNTLHPENGQATY